MLTTLDYYLYNLIVPQLKIEYFKSKIFSFLVILYVCFFSNPRKFLKHYFFGNGSELFIDTRKTILNNHVVLHKILNSTKSNSKGLLNISQTNLFNPNYRYSIGSFQISYEINNDIIEMSIFSNYSYNSNDNRITKHLHNWLDSYNQRHSVSSYNIIGKPCKLSFNELNNSYASLDSNTLIKKWGPTKGAIN